MQRLDNVAEALVEFGKLQERISRIETLISDPRSTSSNEIRSERVAQWRNSLKYICTQYKKSIWPTLARAAKYDDDVAEIMQNFEFQHSADYDSVRN